MSRDGVPQLDFSILFNNFKDEQYSVVKLSPEFPKVLFGQDIDIFCQNPEILSQKIISFLTQYVGENTKIHIQKLKNQIQIDLMKSNEVSFRFDLYRSQPIYKKVQVKPSFFDIVVETSENKEYESFSVKVPKNEDECIIRYLEFIEYFSEVPDKLKHIDYIKQKIIKGHLNEERFFERLNYYIKIPSSLEPKTSKIKKIKNFSKVTGESFSKISIVYRQRGLKFVFKKIFEKLR